MSDGEDLGKLTVPLLKARCRELGLPVGGTKQVLITRIQTHLGTSPSPSSSAPAPIVKKRKATATSDDADGSKNKKKAPIGLVRNPPEKRQRVTTGQTTPPKPDAVTPTRKPFSLRPASGEPVETGTVNREKGTGQSESMTGGVVSEDVTLIFTTSNRHTTATPKRPSKPAIISQKPHKTFQGLVPSKQPTLPPAHHNQMDKPQVVEEVNEVDVVMAGILIRKSPGRVETALALALGSTDAETLGMCAKVSKRWNLAAQMAWQYLTQRKFPGSRTEKAVALAQHPLRSLRPYFQYRLKSYLSNISTLHSSWIGRLYAVTSQTLNASRCLSFISPSVMKCPDSTTQFDIAKRFWIARFVYRSAFTRSSNLLDELGDIVDVEILTAEIAAIRTVRSTVGDACSKPKTTTYLTVAETGDPFATIPGPTLSTGWTTYFRKLKPGRFLDQIPTLSDSHPHNIHTRITHPPHLSIASRFILAHAEGYPTSPPPRPSLPPLHHPVASAVESVSTRRKRNGQMCGDLAFVQTVSGGVWVLRETGLSVGTEDGGVNPLWMEVLGCSCGGKVMQTWKGGEKWAAIMRRIAGGGIGWGEVRGLEVGLEGSGEGYFGVTELQEFVRG
ncbi:hypothetical protein HK104_010979 [Borealophlyctis nickersoniae]|nr:hypothetical protein HK104_010979 [Borealophlyctis nickersoniae]